MTRTNMDDGLHYNVINTVCWLLTADFSPTVIWNSTKIIKTSMTKYVKITMQFQNEILKDLFFIFCCDWQIKFAGKWKYFLH